MNWLAHLFLADRTEESIIGNLLGDFINYKDEKLKYSIGIQAGIRMHIEIDIFTDTHPIVRLSKSRISDRHKREAGILVDLFYDHFLAKNWNKYSKEKLEDFTGYVYSILEKNKQILPERLADIIPYIKKGDLLASYRNISGVAIALERISKKISRPNKINKAVPELLNNYNELEQDFFKYFTLLIEFVNKNADD